MVFRKLTARFCKQNTKKKASKYIINEEPKTYNDQVYPQLPFLIRSRRVKIKCKYDNTPKGQMYNLTFALTDLFRDERVCINYYKAIEIRPHAERLIVEAMRNGDRHRPTMALANYWLREKNLIHKLFKVYVPRYSEYASSFTALHMLGKDCSVAMAPIADHLAGKVKFHPGGEAVLEMRGNILPPIIRPKVNKSGLLTNILIDGARESRRQEEAAAAMATAAAASVTNKPAEQTS